VLAPASIGFRDLTHADVAFAAEAQGADDPLHPKQPAELLDLWVNTDRSARTLRYAVLADGAPVGWVSMLRWREDTAGSVDVELVVPSAGHDTIDAALAHAEESVLALEARSLVLQVLETNAPAIAVLEARGWERKRRERFWRLELAPNAGRLLELRGAARNRAAAAGVELLTAADLGGEAVFPDLYRVSIATEPDIPSSVPYEPNSYQDWLVWMQPPSLLPERIWIAAVDGRAVGYSSLAFHRSLVETFYTGVLREHRGQGLARALKLETLGQAIELGVAAVETDNDSENAPILHLNAELGYREMTARLEFHKAVGQGAS
jgi:GNAT superfamily N-acetyltransferase